MSDQQWAKIEPHLPQPLGVGRPAKPNRLIVEGILWTLRTGAPWRDLPKCFGPWSTVYSRFRKWRDEGVWGRLLTAVQRDADLQGAFDWHTHFVDSTIVRAHQHAAGAPRSENDEALGRSRGGFSTKVHVRTEGGGKPFVVLLSGGERHESKFLAPLLEAGQLKRAAQGRPRSRPEHIVGDKGYSYSTVWSYLRRRGIRCTIPRRSNQPAHQRFDREAYRERNRVERAINRLKHNRRVATRYDKQASSYLAFVQLAAVMLWV